MRCRATWRYLPRFSCAAGATAILAISALTDAAHAGPVDVLHAGLQGRIEFMSSTPKNRWTLARSPRGNTAPESPLMIWGDLLFPSAPTTPQKVPAVVVSHGSEGVSTLYYDVWAKAFLAAGYAVFIVDSQKPRGVARNLGTLQLSWNTTANIADGFSALRVLATHPDIDASRIFHIGFSRGASASYASAWPIYQQVSLPDGVRYAGHIAVYPGCNLRFHEELTATNTAPLLLLLAGKDDMTPAQPCVEYAQYLASEGHDVRYKLYPEAHHVFDRLNQPWARFKEGTSADCSLEHTVTNHRTKPTRFMWGNYKTGERFTEDGAWLAAQEACRKEKWITVESHPESRNAAVTDVLAFMNALR